MNGNLKCFACVCAENRGIVYLFSVLNLIIDPESLWNVISVEFFTSDTMPIVCSVCGMQKKGYNSLNAEFLSWNYYDQMMSLSFWRNETNSYWSCWSVYSFCPDILFPHAFLVWQCVIWFLYYDLTHLCWMEFPTLINWTIPFLIQGLLGSKFSIPFIFC